jgi:hypothetical protein
VTLSPGTYVGGIAIDGTASVTLLAGVYYMQGGGFSVSGNGSVTDKGAGVVLVNAPAGPSDVISITGQGSMSLTASSSLTGAYAAYDHIAIFQDPASANAITVTGASASLTASGTLYAPGALLKIDGKGKVVVSTDTNPTGGQVIVFDTTVSVNGALTINADPPNSSVPATAFAATVPALPSGAARGAQPFAALVGSTEFAVVQAALALNGPAAPGGMTATGTPSPNGLEVPAATTSVSPALATRSGTSGADRVARDQLFAGIPGSTAVALSGASVAVPEDTWSVTGVDPLSKSLGG